MRRFGLVLLIFSGLLLLGCTPDHKQSTFDASGPVAESQLILFYWIFWAAVFVFVTVVGALLYTIVRYRRRDGDGDPEQIHGHKALEITWTIVPTLVLAVIAVPTIMTIFHNANSPDPGGMQVKVVAHQWWWEFQYVNPEDPQLEFVTANELHIPVGEVVNLDLNSEDVLHSFWIPKIAGKVDLVPNERNTMWIQASDPGEYLGQCAEFCGVSHALMRFTVIAEPRSDFDTWLRHQASESLEPVDPLAIEGRELFEGQAQCFSCHTVDGLRKSRGTKGPNLTHVASRRYIAAGILENTQSSMRSWLENPNSIKPGNIMFREALVYNDPNMKLTGMQIEALVSFLQTLK